MQSNTKLQDFVKQGYSELVQQLVDAKADVNYRDDNYEDTLLHTAISAAPVYVSPEKIKIFTRQYFEVARILLKAGANPNQKASARSPLGIAIERGWSEMVTLLLESRADANQKLGPYCTPLDRAIELSHLDMVQSLVKFKATVGSSELGIGIKYASKTTDPSSLVLIKTLLDAKADVNHLRPATSIHGTHLIHAIDCNHLPLVNLLLENKAEVDLQGSSNGSLLETPLSHALRKPNIPIAQKLLEYKASLYDIEGGKKSALHLASRQRLGLLVSSLIEKKADVGRVDAGGRTPLHDAASSHSLPIIKALLFAKADVNRLDNLGRSPLFGALEGIGDAEYRAMAPLMFSPMDNIEETLLFFLNANANICADKFNDLKKCLHLNTHLLFELLFLPQVKPHLDRNALVFLEKLFILRQVVASIYGLYMRLCMKDDFLLAPLALMVYEYGYEWSIKKLPLFNLAEIDKVFQALYATAMGTEPPNLTSQFGFFSKSTVPEPTTKIMYGEPILQEIRKGLAIK